MELLLGIVNTLLIVIIIAVLIVDTIYIMKLRKAQDDVKTQVSNIVSKAISAIDLAEFNNLDPRTKQLYKEYIVSILAPAVMKVINSKVDESHLHDYIKANKKEIDALVLELANNPTKVNAIVKKLDISIFNQAVNIWDVYLNIKDMINIGAKDINKEIKTILTI